MDVGEWLRGLGLGQYEEKFRDNKIDADLLPRLTVDDLKEAGAGPPAEVPGSPTKSGPSKGLQASAERRPITVMFCDLVGSTGLAAKLDAEDWRNLVNAYLFEATRAVTGLGGHVLKKLGDGLMALFGYPQAQENDAERAVRAALAIQRSLMDLNVRNAAEGGPELVARIGLEVRAGRRGGQRRSVRGRAKHRCPRSGRRRTRLSADHGKRAAAGRRSFRRRGARSTRTQRRSPTDPPFPRCPRERRSAERRRASPDAIRRPW